MFHQRSPIRETPVRSSQAILQSSERAQVWDCLLDRVPVQLHGLSLVYFLGLLVYFTPESSAPFLSDILIPLSPDNHDATLCRNMQSR